MDPLSLIVRFIFGYIVTTLIEIPVLYIGLGKRYTPKTKLIAGLALTGFSYPFVVFVFPFVWNPFENYGAYLWVAETFAPLSECLVFALVFQRGKTLTTKQPLADMLCVIGANLASFLLGELLKKAL